MCSYKDYKISSESICMAELAWIYKYFQATCTLATNCSKLWHAVIENLAGVKRELLRVRTLTETLLWPPTFMHSHGLSSTPERSHQFSTCSNFSKSWWEFEEFHTLSDSCEFSWTLIHVAPRAWELNKTLTQLSYNSHACLNHSAFKGFVILVQLLVLLPHVVDF